MENNTSEALSQDAARDQIATLMEDQAWQKARFDGDKGKDAEWTRLMQAAHPEPQPEAEQAKPEPVARDPNAAANEPDESAPLCDPPRGPHEYESYIGSDASDADVAREMGFRNAAFAAELPTFAYNIAAETIQRCVKAGIPDEAAWQGGYDRCMIELERKHGAKGAEALINDARKAFARVTAKNADIGTMMDRSGAGNTPYLIETMARVQRAYYAKRGK